jgi:hypothetical protein
MAVAGNHRGFPRINNSSELHELRRISLQLEELLCLLDQSSPPSQKDSDDSEVSTPDGAADASSKRPSKAK